MTHKEGLNVGISCLFVNPEYKGGTNSFTFGLLDGFVRVGGEHGFTLFVNPWNKSLFEPYEDVPHFRVIEVSDPASRWHRAIERRLPSELARRLGAGGSSWAANRRHARVLARESDLLYVPCVPPPDFAYPTVTSIYSIHDIQHAHYPEFFTEEELRERELAFAKCIEHADVVQASSRYMRLDFCEHFPKLNESNVEVISEGVDLELFGPRRPDDDLDARYGLPESFIFMPAQLWPHKNHLTVLRALKRLAERGIVLPLVLTGAGYNASASIFEFVNANGLAEHVLHLGLVPFEDLIALYQRARFLVTAALYESSSLPILEAAAAGTPIVAARTPPNAELAEHLQMRMFTPTDDVQLAEVLEDAWGDEKTNAAQAEANKVAVQRYSWDNAARRYIELFERLQRGEHAER